MDFRRKFERIVLSPIENAYAKIHLQEQTLSRPIHNISYRGMGILPEPGDAERIGALEHFPLSLEIEGTVADTQGHLVHTREAMLGINFVSLSEVSRRIVSAYLDPRYLGSLLKEVPAELVHEKGSRIFFGPNGTRLYVHSKSAGSTVIDRVELVFLGGYLHIDEKGIILTGELDALFMADEDMLVPMSEEAVQVNAQPNVELLATTMKLLRYAPLDSSLRQRLELHLHGAIHEGGGSFV